MVTLSEYLAELDFDYKINDNNTISLIDLQGANLAGIENEQFEINSFLPLILSDRLSVYENDYFFEPIKEILNDNNIDDIDSFIPYSVRLIEAMKLLPKEFDTNYIQLITDICNYNIDISELYGGE